MPFLDLALVAAALLASGLVKGVTGIGYATCAMPLLTMAVGLETALALIVAPALASNVMVMTSGRQIALTARRFHLFYIAILPGIACGTLLLVHIDKRWATHGLALLTLAYVVLALARPRLSMPARLERPLALPAGLMNGVLTGLTGSQIMPLVPYMLALRLDAETQVQAINLAVTIAAIALGSALLATGQMTGELLAVSAAGALPAVLGTWAGNVMRAGLAVAAIRRLTLAALVLAAVSLSGREAAEAALAAVCGASPRFSISAESIAGCMAAVVPPMTQAFDFPASP